MCGRERKRLDICIEVQNYLVFKNKRETRKGVISVPEKRNRIHLIAGQHVDHLLDQERGLNFNTSNWVIPAWAIKA